MPPSKIRFVTACQQLLALGVVLAVLTPAASVISLDVVHDRQQARLEIVPEDQVAPASAGSPSRRIVVSRDLTGDGRVDRIVRGRAGQLRLLPGIGDGRFGAPVRLPEKWHRYARAAGSAAHQDLRPHGRG